MSSYIPKQPKRERDQNSIKLDRQVLRKLELYGRFLESSRDYIISAALELVFRKDKAFTAWLETEQGLGATQALPSTSDRLSTDRPRPSLRPSVRSAMSSVERGFGSLRRCAR